MQLLYLLFINIYILPGIPAQYIICVIPVKTLDSHQKVVEEKLPHLKQAGKHDRQIVSTKQEIIEFSKLEGSCYV